MRDYIKFLFFLIPFLYFNQAKTEENVKAVNSVRESLKSIPREECAIIRQFFTNAVYHSQFGYTLFGYKAVSLTSIPLVVPICDSLIQYSSYDISCKFSLNFLNLFPSDKFILIEELHQKFNFIFLINTKLFSKTVSDNLSIFKKHIGSECTPESLLREIKKNNSLNSSIKNNKVLLGILLGYGEKNAKLFERRNYLLDLKNERDAFRNTTYFANFDCLKSVSLKFLNVSLESELAALESQIDFIGHDPLIPFLIDPIAFVGDKSDPETKRLIRKYFHARAHLNRVYSKGDLLEITLCKWISG